MTDLALTLGLFVFGFALLAAEIFVIPGFGIAGILGTLLVAGGCVLAWTAYGAAPGLVLILLSVGLITATAWLFSRSRTGQRLVLRQASTGDSTDTDEMSRFIGKTGEAVSTLRPSGTALIDGERCQVVTDGEYVRPGTPIKVVRIGTNSLVVSTIDETTNDGA